MIVITPAILLNTWPDTSAYAEHQLLTGHANNESHIMASFLVEIFRTVFDDLKLCYFHCHALDGREYIQR